MAGSRWGAPCVAAFDWGLWCTPRCLWTWQKEDTTCLENRALVLSTIPLTSLGIEREAAWLLDVLRNQWGSRFGILPSGFLLCSFQPPVAIRLLKDQILQGSSNLVLSACRRDICGAPHVCASILLVVAMLRPRATAQRPGMNSVGLLFASSHMGFRLQLSRVRSAYIRACARVSCLVGSSYGMPCAASCSCKCFQLTSDSHLESCLLMSEDSRRAWMQFSCTLPAPASMHSRARLHMKLL